VEFRRNSLTARARTCRAKYHLHGVGERTVADAGERGNLELIEVVGAEVGDDLLCLDCFDGQRAPGGRRRRHAATVDTITLQCVQTTSANRCSDPSRRK